MKNIKPIIAAILFVGIVFIWQGCCRTKLQFSGKVVDRQGDGIPGATIKVGEKKVDANTKGEFEICVDRADKYVLNVSKLEFGFYSKAYSDTATHLIITLAKATVVKVDPNQNISVQDTNPDISSPAGASTAPLSPLDTIPFVYDAKGSLIGFKRPQSSIDARKAIANFQSPVLGAKIEIPAGSLVFATKDGEKTKEERRPTDSIDVSVNTIDVYSPGSMPGNYEVDLGNNQRAFMQTYGAANIEAYYKGEALQLGNGKTATLTIPIDTLSIISKRNLPNQIPLLVYNTATGYWNEAGQANINATRDAYVATVSHFTTYNMDLEKTTPSCLQLCVDLTASTDLDIYPGPASGLADMTWIDTLAPVCNTPPTDCSVYGISVANTSGVRNIENNVAINVDVIDNSTGTPTIDASYVLYSGPQPGGGSISPDVYQSCNWNDCAGPFYISNDRCWEVKSATAPHAVTGMSAPVMTFQQNATTSTDIDFNWIFVQSTSGGAITNSLNYYEIEYQIFPSGTAFTLTNTWKKVVFTYAGGVQADHFPRSTTGENRWDPPVLTGHFIGGGDNTPITMSDILVFRVNVHVGTVEPSGANPTLLGVISIRNFGSLNSTDQTNSAAAVDSYSDPSGLPSPACHIIIN